MLVAVSGMRSDGSAWPGIGGVLEVSEVEGQHMVTGQLAVPVDTSMADVETAVPSTAAVEAREALVPGPKSRRSR
jgi:hypothetical protein